MDGKIEFYCQIPHRLSVDPDERLLGVLSNWLGLMETKEAVARESAGRVPYSWTAGRLTPACCCNMQADCRRITTIEGIGSRRNKRRGDWEAETQLKPGEYRGSQLN